MWAIHRDRFLICALLVVSIAWTVMAETTIPGGYSGSIVTPKSFPQMLGILLGILSLILLVQMLLKTAQPEDDENDSPGTLQDEMWACGITFGFLIVYFAAMQMLGFTVATILVVGGFLFVVLKQRSPALIIGMSVGLSIGLYVLMNKLLGVQLPAGMLGWEF